MGIMKATRNNTRQITFEDLKGLRGEGYIRDSTLDQRNGFGPEIQRKNILRFSETYELSFGTQWYTEFISSFRRWDKRQQFQRFIDDAKLDLYDVLLVDHTSRFGRNQAECIRYKEELQRLGKVVVFVSQGIISGSDRDFLAERINETLDEQYSRNLSRYVASGMAEKSASGLANGLPPLGYRSELRPNQLERKVPNPETLPVLLILLRDYGSGKFSFREVADHLNSLAYRTRNGRLFTGYTVKDVLRNRFYEGKVIFHRGLSDEQIVEGSHEVSEEVKELWQRCQKVKGERQIVTRGQPRATDRHYPFSSVLRCQRCHQPYYGEAIYLSTRVDLRLMHERHATGRNCAIWPRSQTVEDVSQQFKKRVLSYLTLPDSWEKTILAAMRREEPPIDVSEVERIERALENLRKQHTWGDLTDEKYRQERSALQRQIKLVSPPSQPRQLPNLERAAELLKDLPALWSHPGVTDEQRESLIREVFVEITIDSDKLTSIEPKSNYAPLFATIAQAHGYCGMESPPSPPAISVPGSAAARDFTCSSPGGAASSSAFLDLRLWLFPQSGDLRDRRVLLQGFHQLLRRELDVATADPGDPVAQQSHRQKLVATGVANQGPEGAPQIMHFKSLNAGPLEHLVNQVPHPVLAERLPAPPGPAPHGKYNP